MEKQTGLLFGVLALLFALVPVWGPLLATPSIIIGIMSSSTALKKTKAGSINRPARAGRVLSIGAIAVMVINTVGRWQF